MTEEVLHRYAVTVWSGTDRSRAYKRRKLVTYHVPAEGPMHAVNEARRLHIEHRVAEGKIPYFDIARAVGRVTVRIEEP